MGLVISPCNRKGGVGKSSTVFHLGGYFAAQEMNVLLIDNEPQHSLTNGLIGPEAASNLPLNRTTAALFRSRRSIAPEQLIRETAFKNICLVCGSDALDAINGPIQKQSESTLLAIRRFVEQVQDDFDVILIDNPPNLQVCTYSSLAASNFTYCVTKPQEYDIQGLVPVRAAIDHVLSTTNPTLRMAGYLLNMYQSRRSLHRAYEKLLRDTYPGKVFETKLPDWNDYAEALTARKPVSFYKPSSLAAKVIEQLAEELHDRMVRLYESPPEFQLNVTAGLPKIGTGS